MDQAVRRFLRAPMPVATALLAGCTLLASPSSAPSATVPPVGQSSIPSLTPTAGGGRLGQFAIQSPDGKPVGSLTASRQGATTTLVVHLSDKVAIHPWGIYDQARCAPPSANHDAPFQFADIEAGLRTEVVESSAYLGFPGQLVLLVFSSGGSSLIGCSELGGAVEASAQPSQATCRPAVRPEGGTPLIAFSREVIGNADIYVMNADGSDIVRMTTAVGIDIDPSWSPDGSRIAFRSVRDGQDEIYVMNADGSCQRNLSRSPVDDRSPAWSPDGRLIAFDHFSDSAFQDIAVISPDGGEMRRITQHSGEYAAWSPDGKRLAFASARDGDYEIYVINLDGSGERRLTDNASYDMYPAWSPNGQWIAYESGDQQHLQIHLMHPDGTGDRRITHDDAQDRFPAWSTDGRLAWSQGGLLLVASTPDAAPVPVGNGQFPAWQP